MINDYKLKFSEEVQKKILELVTKYSLTLNKEDFWNFTKKDPEIVIFKMAKKIINKEGSFKDISNNLKKDLNMHQKNSEDLANDIKNHVAVLAEMEKLEEKTIDQQENLEQEKKEAFARAKEELMQKIGANRAAQETITKKQETNTPAMSYKKNPDIVDVEENAKTIEHIQQKTEGTSTAPAKPAQTVPLDQYKEPIE